MGKTTKQREKSSSDLAKLGAPSDDSLCVCLRSRYDTGQVYTQLGPHQLVALNNPSLLATLNDDATGLDYVAAYKDIQQAQQLLDQQQPPHLFELVNRAYFHMRRTGNDQCILLRGDSGSGKSQIRELVIRHLVRLSSHKKETKVQTQLVHSQRVLDIFGSASASNGGRSSRYGYYVEIQFSERGRMVGAKTIHYFPESQRVVSPQLTNFDVFYQLVAGASAEERTALQIQPTLDTYRYLNRNTTPSNNNDHPNAFADLKAALKMAGFRKDHIARIVQLLAAILHLGNLVFVDPTSNLNSQEAAYVKNTEVLDLVADLLGVDPRALENVLVFKTTLIRKDVTTLILNADQASAQRDELAHTLYSLLFAWMVERINTKLCAADESKFNSFVGVLDFPGLQQSSQGAASFYSFVVNVAAERVHQFMVEQLYRNTTRLYESEGILSPQQQQQTTASTAASEIADLLYRPTRGVCSVINSMSESVRKGKSTVNDANLVDTIVKYNGNNSPYFSVRNAPGSQQRQFAIQHFGGQVTYDPTGFLAQNNATSQVAVDFVSLFRGTGGGNPPSSNQFVVDLWDGVATENHPRHQDAVVSAQQKQPARKPSVRQSVRRKGRNANKEGQEENGKDKDGKDNASSSMLGQTLAALDELFNNTLQEATLWTVFCIRPNNNSPASTQFDSRLVAGQIKAYGLADLARHVQQQYAVAYEHQEFLDRYQVPLQQLLDTSGGRLPRAQLEILMPQLGWTQNDAAVGSNKIFLAFGVWRWLEDQLRGLEKEEQRRAKDEEEDEVMTTRDAEEGLLQGGSAAGLPPPPTGLMDDRSFYSEDDMYYQEGGSRYQDSVYGSESYINTQDTDSRGMMLQHNNNNAAGGEGEKESYNATEEDESKQTPGRKRWLFLVWALTWWIPSAFLIWCGRMKRKDVRIAWREKVALCIIIFFLCVFVIWFLVFFGEVVCPYQAVYSESELASHSSKDDAYVAIRGEVFDLTSFAPRHYPSNVIPVNTVLEYGGQDVTDLFPVQVSALCQGTTGSVSPYVSFNYQVNLTDDNAKYHDFRYSSGNYQPDWYYEQMTMLRQNYKKGNMGYEPKEIAAQASSETTVNGVKTTRKWAIIDNHIYDLTQYDLGGRFAAAPPGETAPAGIDVDFMDQAVVDLFRQKSGEDISQAFWNLPIASDEKERQLVCLRNLFFVGMVDTRNSAKCQFSNYLLLIITCLLCAVIVFKFLAAFRLGGTRAPEELDKFVITQVTCYTEDEESLRKTIDSLATLHYDDKRKLLFVICDGMIVGSGNDRPTPRIVLDILGVDPAVDPEPLSFLSVGEGQKQHNMGKIYSGLYEVAGHVVPYLVVVKCGKPTERQKPGNRGKRDSQLVLMNFLNRVHFDAPMTPLQLEMYHQMKNVIGVSPEMYEFVLMVDADTEVMKDGLNNLVSSMAHDSKIIGICGETQLANEKATWATMIQVYEYFISHHMTKAFESLFSTVTCLPGCFTMYRVRTVDGKRLLFCSNEVINDYNINKVDTLHKKNLLHLGEDRYLTTLLLKHFPNYKTKFTSHAQCKTNAPDTWNVLVSQRRRWINSTVHNLSELTSLSGMCGFCCFSMRFIVMLDLISTLVMPAIVGYLGYLIYKLVTLENQVPYLTIIVIAGTYGLQALLFIVKRRWEYILWMLVSILAIPLFWFYIPLYSFWHFDDFSWGNTRVVVGEKGKKVQVADEGEFDPKSIPMMTWSEYEKMILSEDYWSDGQSQASSNSRGSYYTHKSRTRGGGSVYGGGDNMSMYTPSTTMLNNNHRAPSQISFFPDNASVLMPPYPPPQQQQAPPSSFMARSSMASFAPPPPQDPYRQSRPSMMMPSSSSFMVPPNQDNSSQSLLMDDLSPQGGGPSNEEILQEVKRILATADLTKVTKKQVREELQSIFGVPMANRKDYINACIENVLQGRM